MPDDKPDDRPDDDQPPEVTVVTSAGGIQLPTVGAGDGE
jgi:hypothetical protein